MSTEGIAFGMGTPLDCRPNLPYWLDLRRAQPNATPSFGKEEGGHRQNGFY